MNKTAKNKNIYLTNIFEGKSLNTNSGKYKKTKSFILFFCGDNSF